MSMKKKLKNWAVFLALLAGVIFLTFTIIREIKKINQVRSFQKEIEALKKENLQLQAELDYVETEDFLRQESYEKLGLARKGETVLVIIRDRFQDSHKEEKKDVSLPSWRQWWQLFFGR